MKATYMEENGLWFVKYNNQITGGRYDTQETAKYAASKLSLTEMDELWFNVYKDYTESQLKGGIDPTVSITKAMIDNFLIDKSLPL